VVCQGPFRVVGVDQGAEREVGRPPRLDRWHELAGKLRIRVKRELDLLAGLMLEGCDDFPDRLVLLSVVALVPPYHEVGGRCAEGGQNQERS
jgi:hypothetical protein